MNIDINNTPTEAFELASFETPDKGPQQVPAVRWSIEKHRVASMLALEGKSRAQISRETTVPEATIKKWQENKEFQDYVQAIVNEEAGLMKSKLLQIKMKMLDARIAQAEETGDWAALSRKDTLDIMAEIREETVEKGDSEKSRYEQILSRIVDAAVANKQPALPESGTT